MNLDVRCFDQPMPYADAAALQHELVTQRSAGEIGDTILFLEHPPTITLGRRGRRAFLLATESELAAQGFALEQSNRGGDVTAHMPGQLVMYPILDIAHGVGARGYLCLLQTCAIQTARAFGVNAFAREGMAGAWTAHGKIAAIGFAVKHWISSHGVSFNVHPDLRGFDLIVGCGLQGEKVSSLAEILGKANCPSLSEVRDMMLREFVAARERPGNAMCEVPN